MSLLTANFNNQKIDINNITYNDYSHIYKTNLTCLSCNSQLQAVLQTEKTKHFRHASVDDCDSFNSNEDNLLLWHRLWQSIVNIDNKECVIEKNGKKHRADIYFPEKDLVIEIQHSHIEPEKIKNREIFYNSMIWIIDGTVDINIKNLCDKCIKISDLCNKCTENIICSKRNTEISFEGKNFYIISTKKNYFQNMKEDVFIHCDGFICKFIAKLQGTNILCEKMTFEDILQNYFFTDEKETNKIKENFNKLYCKSCITHLENLNIEYIINNKKLIINSDKSTDFTDYGFEFINDKWIFTYQKKEENNFRLQERKCYHCNNKNEICNHVVELNTKLCFDCNKQNFLNINKCTTCNKIICSNKIKSIEELIKEVGKNRKQKNLCDFCYIKSITCSYCKKIKNNNICDYCTNFTIKWYKMFKKNKLINKGEHSENYSRIYITKKTNIYQIIIDNEITFNYNKDSKYIKNKSNLNIYFVNKDLIEIIKVDNREIYRTKLQFSRNSILDTLGDHLFLIKENNDKDEDYTKLRLINKEDFINEINIMFNQKLVNDDNIEIKYKLFDFDSIYKIYNDEITIMFYKMCSIFPENLDFYYLAEQLSQKTNKNEKVFNKFIEWYEKYRDKSNDNHPILHGKYKGKRLIDIPLKEIKLMKPTVNNNDTLMNQNKNEIINIFYNS